MRKSILRAATVLTLVILLALLVSAQGNWVRKADAPVSGGYGEAVVGTCQFIYLVKELYASSMPEFWRYDCQLDTWQSMSTEGLPLAEGNMPFRTGTALAWDGGNFIYALGGGRGKDKDQRLFFRYVISEDHWQVLRETPHPQGAGDALAWSGFDLKLYAFLGSNERGSHFAVYDPRDNTWDDSPPERWTITDDGASLTWAGGEYIYALRGEWHETIPNGDFARYHIPMEDWEDRETIPEDKCEDGYHGSGCGVGDGASLLWVGIWMNEYSDSIFALGGGGVIKDPQLNIEYPGYNFYRYSISKNEWKQLADIPCPIGFYTGNRLASACGYIYYWQGSPTSDKWECKEGSGCSEPGRCFYMFEFPASSQSPSSSCVSGGHHSDDR